MTAPLFHLSPASLDEATSGVRIRLDGPEGHHAATVMRLGTGEEVLLSDARSIRVTGVVVASGGGELTVEVREVVEEPPRRPRLVLVQALAKDKRDLQAVESVTELGADAVVPWQADRSVARWKQGREAKKHHEWVNIAAAAAKQTRRTAIPEVRGLHTTAQYLELLRSREDVAAVVLHETEHGTLSQALGELDLPGDAEGALDELHLVVGPEGGISGAEVAGLVESGAVPARLGPTVLRSSTAGPAAMVAAQLLLGRWDT